MARDRFGVVATAVRWGVGLLYSTPWLGDNTRKNACRNDVGLGVFSCVNAPQYLLSMLRRKSPPTYCMAPNPLQLAGIGVAALAVVLAITATATKGWLVLSVSEQAITVKSEMGLFTSCVYRNGEEFLCQDLVDTGDPSSAIVCGSHTVGDTNAYVRAMQAMSILSILVGAAAVGLAAAKATVLPIKLPVDAGLSCLAAAIAFVTFVLFAVFYGTWLQCGTSMCDGACNGMNDCSCGLNYSFALSVVSFVLFAVGGVLMFLGPRAHPVMGSEERDNSASSYHAYDKAT